MLGCRTTLVLEMSRLGPDWIALGCSTALVLEMPRLAFWLEGCAGLQYNFSTGNASFGVRSGLCLVVVQLYYWKCLL